MSEPTERIKSQEPVEELSLEIEPQLTEEQELVNLVANQALSQEEPLEGVDLTEKTVKRAGGEKVAQAVEKGPFPKSSQTLHPPIVGGRTQFSGALVQKIVSLFTLKEPTAERKEDLKRERAEKQEQAREIKKDVEKRRALLRGIRNFLKKADTKDYNEDLAIVEELSEEDLVELERAFADLMEDRRLFEGMQNYLEGLIERDQLGKGKF